MNKDIDIRSIIEIGRMNNHRIQMNIPVFCPVTGDRLKVYWDGDRYHWNSPNTQKAHLISNSKAMLKKYGKAVIDHPYNWIFVSGLEANNAIQIKNQPELEKEIIRDIMQQLNTKGSTL